ncbi:hypothetical protein A2331_05580 [Candidatus Falkowbacteria bacterium RIFOXYB2_FULL_34_18]|uniref:Sulfatase N-terminal domain-containing protein n=1 Tax=Candidatus Falkowbacteria bacterium RIFOXYD2_FULL_34_120 TaxID=1798007 RepID=A0A1F5TRY0_9BACT|nr:MAG: hypothetical protein A2331_05580 [Candidatus Falkowbacteria bacterium RIFOXYB2_FULL_34_18]OGF29821.1 MAG: hypothetical protein A2500_01450 [Candidatus Falkowbacteria bacterium RIFOXYC12_FULL_34_55]OGF37064.1 MAG: hypothetical protein A2466_05755 [Candidatus Falkowbacteria bacterium RIFOXYC2_FULL_34_220]OGF39256.1 MAG: hypothetical protein A2515_00965 [Candidatus Falkowbacteria bacterium RIFOXYD12_FULL_34_57]OGF41361.1 MAG: hypothetical protein A2531_07175 [Candidatus Falkowbacteria bact
MKSKITNFYIFIFFIFLIFNCFLVAVLSVYSGSLWTEVYKWFQFAILSLVLFYVFYKLNRFFGFIFLFFINLVYLFLVSYFIVTGSHLSFAFLKMYFDHSALSLVFMYRWAVLFLVFFSLLNIFGFLAIKNKILEKIHLVVVSFVFFVLIFLQIFCLGGLDSEVIGFAKSVYDQDRIIDYYQKKYNQLVNESIQDKYFVLEQARKLDKNKLPKFLDNIIVLQIESLNAFLVNEQNTPNFWKKAQEGIWFKKFYGNSVQTILGQENILCSLPTSFYLNLSDNRDVSNILCLPEFFSNLDYKTFFMKSFDLNFAQTGKLMNDLKFNEVHATDIMKEGDKTYKWGYRDDIFWERAFDYLQENKKEKYNFAYIEVGPTNHWPFSTPEELRDLAPYKNPKNHQERFINTTFLQDMFLQIALDRIDKMFPEKNYTLFILGDHSWPAEIHKGNNFNEKESFEENFLTSMAVIVGDEERYKNIGIENPYSQMDIMPSIFELFGISFEENYLAKSFMGEVGMGKYNKHKIVLVQPFATKYLNIIDQNFKFQYSVDKERWISFDLNTNPKEDSFNIVSAAPLNMLKSAKSFFPMLDNRHLIAHALGGVNGEIYTNSLEAFEYNYKNGKRLFEVDLSLALDGDLVAFHDTPINLTSEDFKSKKIKDKYTSLSFSDIINLMKSYPDIKIITDVKDDFYKSFDVIINRLKEQEDESLFKRLIPQVYNKETFYYLKKQAVFDEVIYTLYKTEAGDAQVYNLIIQNPIIKNLTLFPSRFSEKLTRELNRVGVKTFVHTVNDEDVMLYFLDKGVFGFYTDFY